MVKGKLIRPLLTLIFATSGVVLGWTISRQWILWLETNLLTGKPEVQKLFGLIPINPTEMTTFDIALIRGGCVLLGLFLGFIAERVAFTQVRYARLRWESMSAQEKMAIWFGIILGFVMTGLLSTTFQPPWWVKVIAAYILCYLSVLALQSLTDQIRFYFPSSTFATRMDIKSGGRPKLLDTNVIIDGRIADIARAGFLEGPVYVPKFVINELQQIADSSDSLKRARGRRGLDILNQMRKEMELQIPDFAPDDTTEGVDGLLVKVARDVDGAIITNDYNLNKVAELQGVPVMNINELANALKPVVLPGEEMKVTLIKEGKERDQGIGYLDDGTMIVVEGGRRLLGETLEVNVTSVLQTVQGKMIFAKIKENGEEEYSPVENGVRGYPSGRVRRKTR